MSLLSILERLALWHDPDEQDARERRTNEVLEHSATVKVKVNEADRRVSQMRASYRRAGRRLTAR